MKIPATEWETLSGKNFRAEGFDSHKIAERVPMGMYALILLSGANLISEVYIYNPLCGRNPTNGGLTPSGRNPISGDCLAVSE